jgi:hypothetical protein
MQCPSLFTGPTRRAREDEAPYYPVQNILVLLANPTNHSRILRTFRLNWFSQNAPKRPGKSAAHNRHLELELDCRSA